MPPKSLLRTRFPPLLPPAHRRGEGAFRLRPREPAPPRLLDKYELRETKRRLQQGLEGGGRLGPRACAHLSPLLRDPFCGELGAGTLSCQPVSITPTTVSLRRPPSPPPIPPPPAPCQSPCSHPPLSLPSPLHSCLPAPTPPALRRPP